MAQPLMLVALVAWRARGAGRTWRADAFGAWLGALPLWALQLWWIMDISTAGVLPLVAFQALWTGVFVVVASACARSWKSLPLALVCGVVWCGVEFCRSEVMLTGFGWGCVAHPLVDGPLWLTAGARYGGVFAVGGLVAAANGSVVMWTRKASRVGGAVCACGVALLGLLAAVTDVRTNKADNAGSVRVGLVQTNVAQSNKLAWSLLDEVRDFRRFAGLTRDACARGTKPAFVVWPETMMPGLTLEPDALNELARAKLIMRLPEGETLPDGGNAIYATRFADELLALQQEVGTAMVVGEEALVNLRVLEDANGTVDLKQDARFNSVYLVREGRISRERYDKLHLTPFGEVMPIISHWTWLEQNLLAVAAGGMKFDLDEGKTVRVFHVRSGAGGGADGAETDSARQISFATPICFEIVSATTTRRLAAGTAQEKPDLLLNVTNDGWFGDSDLARRQALQQAQWRARELGIPIARAANTGISAVVDAWGRVVAAGVSGAGVSDVAGTQAGMARVDGVLVADVPLAGKRSFYARVGDLVGWSSMVISGAGALVCGVSAVRAWRRKRELEAA